MKKITILIFGIILIMILLSLTGCDYEMGFSTKGKVAFSKEFYELNEEAVIKELSTTVINVEKSNGSGIDKPGAGKEFVIVTLQLKNIGPKSINYNAWNYRLQDSSGDTVRISYTNLDKDTLLGSGDIAPNEEKIGTIVFEAPKGDENLVLIYEENLWTNSNLKFNLQ